MEKFRMAAFLLEYLYKSRSDICEGIGRLKGAELRDHVINVLSLVGRVVKLAVDSLMVAVSFAAAIRHALQKFKDGDLISMSPAKLLEVAPKLVGCLLDALSRNQATAAPAAAARPNGAGIGNAAAKVIEVVSAIAGALTDVAAT